ncbi:MAG: glycosyltransferase family 1 protein [Candidatus Aenigmatarchaeota archaeon]
MKVCLLAYHIAKSTGEGMPRYGAELFDELLKLGVDVEIVVKSEIKTPIIHDNFVIPVNVLKRLKNKTIFHAITARQSIYTPLFTKRCVVTIPDIIPLIEHKLGDSASPILATIYGKYVYNMAKRTTKIITISTLVRDELIKFLKIPKEKIEVVNFGINEQFKPLKVRRKGERIRIGYIGSLIPRKRVDLLIKSYKIFCDKFQDFDTELFIYGPLFNPFLKNQYNNLLKLANDLGLKNVYFKGFVEYGKLTEVYNSFDVFVFPTKYEGFGMPIMEAQRCGVPVITLKDGKIPEEVRKKTIVCNSLDDVAEKINELITNKNYKNKVISEALEYSKKFTWEMCAKETLEVYEELL